jgi:hypothetical protein
MSVGDGQAPEQSQAWRITCASEPQQNLAPLAVIREPRAAWVYGERVSADAMLAERSSATAEPDKFAFVFLSSGATTRYELQQEAVSWMSSRAGEHGGPLGILFRNDRLLWRPGRAVCFGPSAESVAENLLAVVFFSWCEGELSRLEKLVSDHWGTLDQDRGFTDDLAGRALKRRAHVDAMSRIATGMLTGFVRVQNALESPPIELPPAGRRLFVELSRQSAAIDRLERLDDAVEVFSDFYRLASERLTEFKYHRREYRVTVLILIVLAADLRYTAFGQPLARWMAAVGSLMKQ